MMRDFSVPVTSVLSTRLHDGEVTVLQPLSADGRGYAGCDGKPLLKVRHFRPSDYACVPF